MRERESEWARAGEGQRERKTQNLKQAPGSRCQHRARCGVWSHKPRDHDLSWSWILNQVSHPGTPHFTQSFKKHCHFPFFLFLWYIILKLYDSKTESDQSYLNQCPNVLKLSTCVQSRLFFIASILVCDTNERLDWKISFHVCNWLFSTLVFEKKSWVYFHNERYNCIISKS